MSSEKFTTSARLDQLLAFGLTSLVLLSVVVLVRPHEILGRERDAARLRDVQDYFEALYELSLRDPEAFTALTAGVPERRVMIGSGQSCAGSYGTFCQDAGLADVCLDVEPALQPEYLQTVLVNPSDRFSPEQTGYYLELSSDALVVGACEPFGPQPIEIRVDR